MSKYYHWRWWTVALRGFAALILGVIAVLAPGLAFLSLVYLFGVYAIVDGILALGLVGKLPTGMRTSMIARGVISIVAGVLALALPHITAVVLLVVIAAWAIVAGVLEISMALQLRKEVRGEWLLALEGLLSIGFGIVLIVAPFVGAIVLGLWIGAYALVIGGMLIASAFRLRRTVHREAELAAA